MSKYAVMPMTDYEGICDAVRAKTGGTAKLKSSEVKQEIEGIQTGSDPVIEPLTVTENGTYTASSGVDGYNPVTVAIESGGGGAETLFDREYIYGSFTLAEDTTSDYVIADLTEWGDRFPKSLGFMFREKTTRSDTKGMWCGAYQTVQNEANITFCSTGFAWSTNGNTTSIKNGGIKEFNKQVLAKFTTSYVGYAGETYNWLVIRWKKVGEE